MSILVTSDWHLTDLPKDNYRFHAIDWLLQYVATNDVGTVIILGDLTHNKNHHSDTLVNRVVGCLSSLSRQCNVIILTGNHDYVEADTPFFHFVRLMPYITWINTPKAYNVPGVGRCYFLPHTRDYQKDWKDLVETWNDCEALFFAHNAFEGAVTESGKRLSGIPLSVFPKGFQIISGDIHEPQEIEAHGVKLTYVGSPYTQKYGDEFDPCVLILDDGEIKSVHVPGPRHCLIDAHNLAEVQDYVCGPEDMIKVRYHLRSNEIGCWSKIKDGINKIHKDCLIQVITEKETLKRVATERTIKDDETLLRTYGTQQELSPDLMVTGYELCREV